MDCFVYVEKFSEIEFLLQPMFQIKKHSVQKSISGGVYFSKNKTSSGGVGGVLTLVVC